MPRATPPVHCGWGRNPADAAPALRHALSFCTASLLTLPHVALRSCPLVKVLHVSSGLGLGGAETNLRNLLQTFTRTHTDIQHAVVDLGGGGPIARELQQADVDVWSLAGWRELPAVVRGIRRWQPAIVHGWMYRGNLVASLLAGCVAPRRIMPGQGDRLPVVWSVRHSLQDWRGERPGTRALVRLAGSGVWRPQAITFNSRVAQDSHRGWGFARYPMYLVPNALDTRRFRPEPGAGARWRVAQGIPTGAPVLGFVGRAHAVKNLPLWVDVAAALAHRVPQLRLVLAGRGCDAANHELTGLLDRAGVRQRAHLLGEVADTASLYRGVDVLLSTSRSEATSNVLLEAAASGCAALATDVGEAAALLGAAWTVPGPDFDAARLTDLAARLLSDASLRCRTAMQARQRVLAVTRPGTMRAGTRTTVCRPDPERVTGGRAMSDMRGTRIVFTVNEARFLISHRMPLVNEARDRGMDVLIACGAGTGEEELEQQGLPYVSIPLSRSGFNPLHELRTYHALVRLYREHKPDIVHHVTIKPVIYGTRAARRAGVGAVVNAVPGMGFVFTRRGAVAALRRIGVRLMYRASFIHGNMRVIFQNSEDLGGFMRMSIVQRAQAVLIRGSGVDLDEFYVSDEPPEPLVFLLVARMLQHKGVREFVDAAQRLKERFPDWRFQLVGDIDEGNPSSLGRLELLHWHEEGIIEWLGRRDDVADCMAACHVVVLPSYREGLPKSLLEASAAARPMIATDVAGCREVVRPHVNGLLVPARDAHTLAEAMVELGQNPQLRARFGRAAREKAEAVFDIKDVVRHTFLLYQQLLRA